MAEVRFYVFLGGRGLDVQMGVHRRLETVRQAWRDALTADPAASALIHVGTSAPATGEVEGLLSDNPGAVLASESARWSLGPHHEDSAYPLATLDTDNGLPPLPVRLALAGWGYSASDPTGPPASQAVDAEQAGAAEQPDLHSDTAYRERLPSIDPDDPHAVLAIAPTWFLTVPLDRIDLTVRCRNVLRRAEGVETVGDVRDVPPDVMLGWRNFGKKSLRDLAGSLRAGVADPVLIAAYRDRGTTESPGGSEDAAEDAPLPSFDEAVRSALGGEQDRRWYIFSTYFGYEAPPATLQDIADTVGITRERVRQIKKKALAAILGFGGAEEARHRLDVLLHDREHPLYVDLLGVEDPWFETPARPEYIAQLLHEIGSPDIRRFNVGGRWAVSRLATFDWETLVQRARSHVEEASERRSATRADVDRDVAAIALSAGAPELATPLLRGIRDELHFTSVGGTGPEVLVSVGRTVRTAVECVLEGASVPLHFTTVADRVGQIRGEEVAPSSVQRYLNEMGLRLGRGTYGLPRHIPLNDAERREIVDAAVDAVLEGTPGRQWHAKNLTEEVSDRIEAVPECLDAFVLNALLESTPDLRSLGRMVWVSASEADGAERIDLREACVALLQRFGRPMSTTELREEVSKARGVNSGILIIPDERITRIEPGIWGLVERDIPLTKAERDSVASALLNRLHRQSYALHVSEVIDALHEAGLHHPGLTGEMVSGFALVHPDLNVARGALIHPAAWESPRRMNLREAVLEAATQAGSPVSTSEIREIAEELARRPVTNRDIAGLVRQTGLEYDSEVRAWVLAEDGERLDAL